MGFLAEVREELERELFFRDRDLFSQELDLVFIDTTNTFLGWGEESPLVRRGYSRDRRPDQPQVVLCVAVDRTGFPVARDILLGNTADAKAFAAMIMWLRSRLAIRRVVVVADRGMISATSIRLLTESPDAPFDFILGTRMRRQKEVSEAVLARVQAVDLDLDGERYRLRTDLARSAFETFAAAGVRPPSLATHLGHAQAPPALPTPAGRADNVVQNLKL